MAAIQELDIQGFGWKQDTPTTLGASDTLTYDATKTQVLILYNGTAGALTPNIDGDEASTAIPVPGYGTVDASSGLTSASVATGDFCVLILANNDKYMLGTITITGGDGMLALLTEF